MPGHDGGHHHGGRQLLRVPNSTALCRHTRHLHSAVAVPHIPGAQGSLPREGTAVLAPHAYQPRAYHTYRVPWHQPRVEQVLDRHVVPNPNPNHNPNPSPYPSPSPNPNPNPNPNQAPSNRWHPCKYSTDVVRRFLRTQFDEYAAGVRKADCHAELRRRLGKGPPVCPPTILTQASL